ncbi:hypothetical protein, partial [Klebsiella pneumoniae]|uniref:hypothetical protein n=1 Tax=Klebsiella pneumoniae TaxID=573 RepID=UPI0040557245
TNSPNPPPTNTIEDMFKVLIENSKKYLLCKEEINESMKSLEERIEKVNNRFDKKIEEHAAKASRVEKRLEKEKLDEQNDNINKQNVDLKDKCTGTNDSPILLP